MQLNATMTINDSQSLAGHSSSISNLTINSSLKTIQLMKCKRDLLTQKERRRAAIAVEKEDIVDLVSKAWDESSAHIATNQKSVAERQRLGSIELQLVTPSGNSTVKFLKSANRSKQ